MPPELDVNASSDSSTEATLDVANPSVFPDADADATSSAAGVTEDSTLSIVRDVVDESRGTAEAASPAEGQGEGQPTDAEATNKEPDNENFSDVPFAKHPRFQQLLRKAKTFEKDAKDYQNVQNFMDMNGISPEEAAEGFTIMAMMRSDPAGAWAKLQPLVKNLLIAAGEVLPEELAERVKKGEISSDAAFEFSRTQAQLRSVQTNQQFRETQSQQTQERQAAQASYDAAASWEADRRQKDPNFEAKFIPLQKELAFIQLREGKPKPGDVAGVRDQLKRAYDSVVLPPAAPPSNVRPRATAAARPTMSGQDNASTTPKPQTTLEIIQAQVAKRG